MGEGFEEIDEFGIEDFKIFEGKGESLGDLITLRFHFLEGFWVDGRFRVDGLVFVDHFEEIIDFLDLLFDIESNGTFVSFELVLKLIDFKQILLFVLGVEVLGFCQQTSKLLAFCLGCFEIGVILLGNHILEFFLFTHRKNIINFENPTKSLYISKGITAQTISDELFIILLQQRKKYYSII